MITLEQKLICNNNEHHLHTASQENYISGVTSGAFKEVFKVYKQIYPQDKQSYSQSCAWCVLQVFRKVGMWYLNEKLKQ
jgi:hypothetical protein